MLSLYDRQVAHGFVHARLLWSLSRNSFQFIYLFGICFALLHSYWRRFFMSYGNIPFLNRSFTSQMLFCHVLVNIIAQVTHSSIGHSLSYYRYNRPHYLNHILCIVLRVSNEALITAIHSNVTSNTRCLCYNCNQREIYGNFRPLLGGIIVSNKRAHLVAMVSPVVSFHVARTMDMRTHKAPYGSRHQSKRLALPACAHPPDSQPLASPTLPLHYR